MLRKSLVALIVALTVMLPAQSTFARGGHHASHASRHYRGHTAHTGSHAVHGYFRKNGTYVRPHMSGNPGSGNHWHLNHDGSDTLTRPDGSQKTIPSVPSR